MLRKTFSDTWEVGSNTHIRRRARGDYVAVCCSGGPGYPASTWIGAFNIARQLAAGKEPARVEA